MFGKLLGLQIKTVVSELRNCVRKSTQASPSSSIPWLPPGTVVDPGAPGRGSLREEKNSTRSNSEHIGYEQVLYFFDSDDASSNGYHNVVKISVLELLEFTTENSGYKLLEFHDYGYVSGNDRHTVFKHFVFEPLEL